MQSASPDSHSNLRDSPPPCVQNSNAPGSSIDEVKTIQAAASVPEHQLWMDAKRFQLPDGLWVSCDSRSVAPKQLLPWSVHVCHHFTHAAKGGMNGISQAAWYALGFAAFC